MLQGGFKKDSRTWLHKNSGALLKRAAVSDNSEPPSRHKGYRDFYQGRDQDSPSPLITDASGRTFKKDSRTWLHKSSVRRLARSVTSGAILRIASAAKSARRLRNNIHHPVELCTEDALAGWGKEVTRMNSNTEIAHHDKQAWSRLKATLALPPALGDDLNDRLERQRHDMTRVGRLQYGPYHGITRLHQNYTELPEDARDITNLQRRMSNQMHQNSSGSESENDEGDDTDGSVCHCDEYGETRCPRRCPCEGSLSSSPELGVAVDLSGTVCRVAHANSAIEVTRDDLRQLETLMYKTLERRSQNNVHPIDTQSESDMILEKRFVSPVNSCVHLEATVNLSDVCLKDSRRQSQRSRSPVKHVTKIPVLRVLPP